MKDSPNLLTQGTRSMEKDYSFFHLGSRLPFWALPLKKMMTLVLLQVISNVSFYDEHFPWWALNVQDIEILYGVRITSLGLLELCHEHVISGNGASRIPDKSRISRGRFAIKNKGIITETVPANVAVTTNGAGKGSELSLKYEGQSSEKSSAGSEEKEKDDVDCGLTKVKEQSRWEMDLLSFANRLEDGEIDQTGDIEKGAYVAVIAEDNTTDS